MDLTSELFQNWTRSALAIHYACDPLMKFVEPINRNHHQSVLQNTGLNPGVQCVCTFKDAKKCPNKLCNKLLKEIEAAHRFGRLTTVNTELAQCWTDHWEFAKCYMSPGYKHVHTASKTDFLGFVNMIINNLEFQKDITENLGSSNNVFVRAREVRHNIMHTPSFEVTKTALEYNIKSIVKLLKVLLAGYGPTTTDADHVKLTISKVKQLRTCKVTPEDTRHVLLQAVECLKRLAPDIHQAAQDAKEFCEKELQNKTEEGKQEIDKAVSEGKDAIGKEAAAGVQDIYDATEEGKVIIKNKATEAAEEIDDKITGGISEVDERREKAAKQINDIVESQESKFRNIAEKSKEDLAQQFEEMKKEGDELMRKSNTLDEKSDLSIKKLQQITQKCMERICQEASSMGQAMKEPQLRLGETFQQIIEDRITSELQELRQEITTMNSERNQENKELKGQIAGFAAKMANMVAVNNRLDVHHSADKKNAYVSGMVVIGDEKLAVADNNNNSIKIIDAKRNVMMAPIQVPPMLFGITSLNSTELVASCTNKLVFVSLQTENLPHIRLMEAIGQPMGIVYHSKRQIFIVSFNNQKETFKIFQMDGSIYKSFNAKKEGQSYKYEYWNLALDQDKDVLIASDCERRSVLFMDLDGNVLHEFADKNLRNPRGITLDSNGNIYVAEYERDKVFKISSDWTKSEILLDETSGLESPESITYSEVQNCLYISIRDKKQSRIHVHLL